MSNPAQFGDIPARVAPKAWEAFHSGLPIAGEANLAVEGAQLGVPPVSPTTSERKTQTTDLLTSNMGFTQLFKNWTEPGLYLSLRQRRQAVRQIYRSGLAQRCGRVGSLGGIVHCRSVGRSRAIKTGPL